MDIAQQLFEEVKKQKEEELLAQLDHLSAPTVATMLEKGLLQVDTDEHGRQIIRGTTKLATELAYESSCQTVGEAYVPTWLDSD